MLEKNEYITLKQEQNWDKLADDKKFPTPFMISDFTKYVSKDKNILDLGCGYGRILNELYIRGFENLTGVDFSKKMVEKGLDLYPNLNLVKNKGEDLPFDDDSFDSVLLVGVLTSNFQNQKQMEIMSEISRVLKDDGIIYISDFLLNDDARNLSRYQKYEDKYDIYGAFELPEGLILRHHSVEHINNLTNEYIELLFKKTIFTTMNGNKSNGFYYIGKRK